MPDELLARAAAYEALALLMAEEVEPEGRAVHHERVAQIANLFAVATALRAHHAMKEQEGG